MNPDSTPEPPVVAPADAQWRHPAAIPDHVVRGLRATSHGDDLVQLLSPEGELTEHPDYPLEISGDLLKSLYRDMVLVRRFDSEGNALQRQGQLGSGPAARPGGRADRFRPRAAPQDMVFPSYREHGVAWCRGVDPTTVLGMFRGIDHGGWDPKENGFHRTRW